MNNFLNELEIKNFKSVKYLKTDCKRINVFIGKPNVGKSNILEALGLFDATYSKKIDKYLNEFVRYEEISNLFYDDDLTNIIEINTDKICAVLRYHANNIDQADLIVGNKALINHLISVDQSNTSVHNAFTNTARQFSLGSEYIKSHYVAIHADGTLPRQHQDILNSSDNPIKKYQFKDSKDISNKFPNFLLPPYGNNLFTIVDHNRELRKEISDIFSEYGLQFVAYKKERKFEIEKNTDGYINKYHYSGMADTFQRLIFYFAAIDSNKNSVLILEEPEVHSFPPYTQELSNRIIESKENQFFITTHSPYLLQNLISNLDYSELNLYITYFEDYQTKIKKLTKNELKKVSEFGVDLFYNLNEFVKNA